MDQKTVPFFSVSDPILLRLLAIFERRVGLLVECFGGTQAGEGAGGAVGHFGNPSIKLCGAVGFDHGGADLFVGIDIVGLVSEGIHDFFCRIRVARLIRANAERGFHVLCVFDQNLKPDGNLPNCKLKTMTANPKIRIRPQSAVD